MLSEAMDIGTCVTSSDPDLWHRDDKDSQNKALSYCHRCPALGACIEVALERSSTRADAFGVWAGMLPSVRIKLRKARDAELAFAGQFSQKPDTEPHELLYLSSAGQLADTCAASA